MSVNPRGLDHCLQMFTGAVLRWGSRRTVTEPQRSVGDTLFVPVSSEFHESLNLANLTRVSYGIFIYGEFLLLV